MVSAKTRNFLRMVENLFQTKSYHVLVTLSTFETSTFPSHFTFTLLILCTINLRSLGNVLRGQWLYMLSKDCFDWWKVTLLFYELALLALSSFFSMSHLCFLKIRFVCKNFYDQTFLDNKFVVFHFWIYFYLCLSTNPVVPVLLRENPPTVFEFSWTRPKFPLHVWFSPVRLIITNQLIPL